MKSRVPMTQPKGGKRRKWERRYRRKEGSEFCWYLDRPPQELVELVEGGDPPTGAALDLGCGPGVATAYLARFFRPAVGLDIALSAVVQAERLARSDGVDPRFVVAEAPVLPFRGDVFGLIFDRGCLQGIPRPAWRPYFQEVVRLLRPGGVLQLFVSKPMRRFPPLLSYRGVRARLRWLLRRRGPQFLSHSLITSLLPSSMEVLRLEDVPFRPRTGPLRLMTIGLFRKG